ncbi:MAG TPA: sulfotransferase domain-containing protein [Gemmataceae bacterium]|nr:sulfotransferase domain-containing protein [Gemmataceae bacterium]
MAWQAWIPTRAKAWYRASRFCVKHRTRCVNIYHCSMNKAASQWVRGILADERTYRYCGLDALIPATKTGPFPPGTIVSPLYVDYPSFAAIEKPAAHKAFFVMRDPRDVLVSWYFSLKLSHPPSAEVRRVRAELAQMSEAEGLGYSLEFLRERGMFERQRSWLGAGDERVLLLRYEDLIGPNQAAVFEQLLRHCEIAMPRRVLDEVLAAHAFEAVSGRPRGKEDPHSHYRKGVAGDWRNHFDADLATRFREVIGDLLEKCRYA